MKTEMMCVLVVYLTFSTHPLHMYTTLAQKALLDRNRTGIIKNRIFYLQTSQLFLLNSRSNIHVFLTLHNIYFILSNENPATI